MFSQQNSGGGGGGRIAIHAYSSFEYSGDFSVYGGRSQHETGGAGTAYVLETSVATGNTVSRLYVDNRGHKPRTTYIEDMTSHSARTYVIHSSHFGINHFDFDHVTLSGAAHLAFTTDTGEEVSVAIRYLHGDTTGFLHVKENLPISINASDSPFPVSFRVYENAKLETPKGVNFSPWLFALVP